MSSRKFFPVFLSLVLLVAVSGSAQYPSQPPLTDEQKLLSAMHSIRSETLYNYVKELTSERFGGRLTGTAEYNACADWVISLLKGWGVQPGGDNGTYLQVFPNPYTLVFKGGECVLHVPVKIGKGEPGTINKYYKYEDEFIPGGTTDAGEVTAEVVFVGYGITAPELGYDDYAGVDVKGKIVLMDPEAPLWPGDAAGAFPKWRPYSFHQAKLENAVAHGARGMIYNYGPIGNPNNSFREGFVYHHVGEAVVADIFAGTGRTYADTVEKIKKELKPRSFATGKIMTIKNVA
ncbi:MAG: PA domain-containing protein, partial [Candidatus Aminicenantales bacterium]